VPKPDDQQVGELTPDDLSRSADQILRALRSIMQSITIHSKQLYRDAGLTLPQMLCLRAIASSEDEEITAAQVSRQVHLSPATVTGIVDRLERSGFVERERRSRDRRKICLNLTPRGEERLQTMNPSLQDRFLRRLMNIDESEQAQILNALRRIEELMEASNIDAPPILAVGDLQDPAPEEP
jgi:DNA-binding MarR family transcriptional regulator